MHTTSLHLLQSWRILMIDNQHGTRDAHARSNVLSLPSTKWHGSWCLGWEMSRQDSIQILLRSVRWLRPSPILHSSWYCHRHFLSDVTLTTQKVKESMLLSKHVFIVTKSSSVAVWNEILKKKKDKRHGQDDLKEPKNRHSSPFKKTFANCHSLKAFCIASLCVSPSALSSLLLLAGKSSCLWKFII